MAELNTQFPVWMLQKQWHDRENSSRIGNQALQAIQIGAHAGQQQRRTALMEREQLLEREAELKTREGMAELGVVLSEISDSGDWTLPENKKKFWGVAAKHPYVMKHPSFRDIVDNFQQADAAKSNLEKLDATYDLRSEELDQRHDNRLIELDRQYENMLSRQNLAHESRIEIEKLRQQLQVERDALKPTTQRPERFDLDESDRIDYAARVEGLKEWLKAQPTNKKNPDAPYQQYTEKLNALNKEFEPRKKKRTVGQPVGAAPAATVPPVEQRQVGTIYQTPKGPYRWNGSGWEAP